MPNVRDLNFRFGDAIENEKAQFGENDHSGVWLIGFSTLPRIIAERAGYFDQTRNDARGRLRALRADIRMYSM
jgi:hypothetical protein